MAIQDLRRLAKAREKAATRKIQRNLVHKDIELRWTQYDPRQVVSKVDKMNSRQLRSYIKKLDAFTDRSVQFEKGWDRTALPRDMVRRYKKAEAKRNKIADAHGATFANVVIDPAGMTVANRNAMIEASNLNILRAGGNPQNRPYDRVERNVSGIVSPEALERLTKMVERQNSPQFIKRGLIKQRQNEVKFLMEHGAVDQAKAIKGLTLRQYDILKNQTNYNNLNGFRYITADKAGEERLDNIADTAEAEIAEYIAWAKKL